MASIGVTDPENGSLASATEGDCNGDCMLTCLVFADASVIRGGSRGVVAKASSSSSVLLFAFSISIGRTQNVSSHPSNMLLVGVGGSWGSKLLSKVCRVEVEIDDERLEGPLEVALSRFTSDIIEDALAPFLKRHFREKEGNRVPNREARPLRGDSAARRFLELRGLVDKSPSLKQPSARS